MKKIFSRNLLVIFVVIFVGILLSALTFYYFTNASQEDVEHSVVRIILKTILRLLHAIFRAIDFIV